MMPLYELMAYISWWAMPIAYMFSVGCCCEAGPPIGIDCNEFACDDGTTPLNWQVTFDGVGSFVPFNPCGDCGDYNSTTFIATQRSSPGQCVWDWDGALPCDGAGAGDICLLAVDTITTNKVTVALNNRFNSSPFACGFFVEGLGAAAVTYPFDCVGFSAASVSMSNGANQSQCEWGSATFDIQAV